MAKANMFHCLELERTELAFFILAKRAEYWMVFISLEGLLMYQLPSLK
jgi:hypothetical protein